MIGDSIIKQMIDTFLDSDLTLSPDTLACIKNNEECIKASVDRDIDSIRFLDYISFDLTSYTINKALEKGYVLHKDSPDFLAINYDIVKKSISLDVTSANYIEWDKLARKNSVEAMDELIDILVQKGYILTNRTNDYLLSNYEVVKKSISLDAKSADYVDWEELDRYSSEKAMDELIDILIQNGYVYSYRTNDYLLSNYKLVKYFISVDVTSAHGVDWEELDRYNSEKAMDELIDILIQKGYVLNAESIDYLAGNYKIIKESLILDVNNVVYVDWDFLCSYEEIDKLIDLLIEKGYVLNEDSTDILVKNYKFAKSSIDIDVSSADYVGWEDLDDINSDKEMDELIDIIIEKGYVLHEKSPYYLAINYNLVKNSISLNAKNADFVEWDELCELIKDEDIEELIDLIVAGGYVLHEGSPDYLCCNSKVVLASLKIDIDSSRYVFDEAFCCPEVFQYAISNGVKIDWDIWENLTLDVFQDKEVLESCLLASDIYVTNNKLFRDRFFSLLDKFFNTYPTIDIYKNVFITVAKEGWEKFRRDNANNFENLFGKISSELRNSTDFNQSIYVLHFLGEMKKTLEDKYDDFYQAMKEYYDIYHSDVEDKLDKMQPAQDKISYYAALYCGKRKDNYIKEKIDSCYRWLRKFFKLRLDNPTVDNKLVQPKRKAKFKELYQEKNEEVIMFIEGIVQKYSQGFDKDTIQRLIEGFVLEDKAKIEEIIPKPNNYDAYERYEKVDKLIKRLNMGYISLEGPEVKRYQDIIGFDEQKGLYVYTGVAFSEEETTEIENYKKINQVFEKIKRDITLKIKEINIELEITEEEMQKIAEKFPFIDEYFEFDNKHLSSICFGDLYYRTVPFRMLASSDNDAYELIYNILIKNGIMWLLVLFSYDYCPVICNNGIDCEKVRDLVVNASNLINLAKELNVDLNTFEHIHFLSNIAAGADLRSIDILGLDIVEKLCKFLGFTHYDKKTIVSRAQRLISKMVGRSMSTVPYVSGETTNYKYSLYDSQDVDVLLAGINTDACFRVDGNDNDFLHYCCLDKNGFVIKITDKDGNFIGRAGGFRNGNCVFLNQLRTIYDRNGNHYKGEYEKETNEIIETLRKACEDIVRTSQENELESEKIDYVFVTRSYSLSDINPIVYSGVEDKIGNYPMDTTSEDWVDFIEDNKNELYITSSSEGFTTDYHNYNILCMASIKNVRIINPSDLKFGDVEALYQRTRNKIIATTNIDNNILRKMKRIKGINSYLKHEEYNEVMIPEGSTVFVGDNWYLVYADGKIVSSCVLEFDEKAKREFGLVQDSLDKLTDDLVQQQLEDTKILIDLLNNGADSGYLLKKVNGSSM